MGHKLFPVHQSGFQKGHSLTTSLAHVTNNILFVFDSEQTSALTLLDFITAYN